MKYSHAKKELKIQRSTKIIFFFLFFLLPSCVVSKKTRNHPLKAKKKSRHYVYVFKQIANYMRLIGFVAILEAERDNIKIKKIVCLVTSHTTYNVMEFSVRSREEILLFSYCVILSFLTLFELLSTPLISHSYSSSFKQTLDTFENQKKKKGKETRSRFFLKFERFLLSNIYPCPVSSYILFKYFFEHFWKVWFGPVTPVCPIIL